MPRVLVFVLALATLLLAFPVAAGLPRPIREQRLANGLRVIISPDAAAADVTLLVRYDVGARDEPRGLEGLAHLVEHAMFMGSKHVPSGDHARLLEQAGATQVNGLTSLDWTTYHETLPPDRLELGLWLESDRMGYFLDRLDQAALERARAAVFNEHRGRVFGTALGGLPFIQHAELFPAWHPYHHVPIGEVWTIAGIRLADVIAWIGTWYGPGNATVVIAGKVDPSAAMALVEKYFGTLPSRPPPSRPALPPITRRTSTHAHVVAGVKAAEVSVTWVTPAFHQTGDAELDVAAAVLTGRGAGWLNELLVSGPRRLCTSVTASQRSMAFASIFEIRAMLTRPEAMKETLDTIRRALARFETGLTDEDVRRARRLVYNNSLFALETNLGWAMRIASAAAAGPLPPAFDGELGRWASVTPADVRRAVSTWLAGKPAVYVLTTPQRGAALRGRLLDTQEVAP
jgi:predicted Zn-dependent peptidase